ncbi:MAG: AsmA family protein [Deltaproteobacteria bacterium]|nr:AsmA family protein [Deltaproteobacteria bacterium]
MKKILLVLSGATALVLAAVIFALTFDINSYKTRIEAAASEAAGMDVRINGKIKLTFLPRAGVSFENILIRNHGADVASAEKAVVGIRLLPLLRREVLIRQVGIISPRLFITKDGRGRFNFETPGKKPAGKESPAGSFDVGRVFIKGGRVLYLNEGSGAKTEANGCDLEVENLSAGGGGFPGALSFDGQLLCEEVKAKGLRVSDIRAVIKTRGGKFEAKPFTMKIFGGGGKGSVMGSMTGESPEYSVDFAITKFRFEEVLGAFKRKKSVRGELDLKSRLAVKGKNADEMTRSARGEISLRGQNLFLEGLDLDRILEKYKKSQNVNLADAGAFLMAGPLGALLTKGYDFGSIYGESLRGEGAIRELASDWKIANGVAEAKDVAFTTGKNRIAFKGRLDFIHDRFEDVTIAVLNADGCAVYSQRIHGAFKNPRMDRPGTILSSLLGPGISLAKKPIETLREGRCEVFYRGSLKQP